MHEYKVLWRMKNSDKYLSVKTSEKSRASVMYNDGISFEDRDRTDVHRAVGILDVQERRVLRAHSVHGDPSRCVPRA